MQVSCLMVTLPSPSRRAMQRRAIEAYLRQTHGDRELVIVVDSGAAADRAAVAALVAGFGRPDIRLLLPDDPLPLGALRNLSVAAAQGDLLCQWDDDDIHHPSRIAMQLDGLERSGARAAILEDVLLFRGADRALFWTRWVRTPVGGHPATLICRREAALRYPETGPSAVRGEDLAAVTALAEAEALHRQPGAPHLYVYVTHAENISGADHHAMLAETLALSTGLLRRREASLRAALAEIDFAGPVHVTGANGPAFTL